MDDFDDTIAKLENMADSFFMNWNKLVYIQASSSLVSRNMPNISEYNLP